MVPSGQISHGIEQDTLVRKTLDFIYSQLAPWRDDAERPAEIAEERLNSQLCKFLDVQARNLFPMARFNHEEHQTGRRRVDLAATPVRTIIVGNRTFTKYEPYLVIEGKRLPAPSKAREKEYVTGFDKLSGGIQRFKLSQHGDALNFVAMVAYVSAGSLESWLSTINTWITGLAGTDCTPGCHWVANEQIREFQPDARRRVSSGTSQHPRTANNNIAAIIIYHLWVSM